jgi:hypothetical protein
MKAEVGDKLLVSSHHVGEPDRTAEIVEVRGANGDPPYLVRWETTGQEGLVYPGSDARVLHPR